ncbi:hypothetical protein [Cuniculiplasma divulgatum]|jgi:hypothetical protein|uniref:Membrane protein n=1 Tax=Cuniculiplasma divulgatum TaxID=1673428 RepID=A0A1N5SSL0_9ARCH|nr:hypothetical protein [Cuniculiplasma divulgatum]EQB69162.1 MAG: hypothetical protein AMDU5_GPLC00004G0132 [Thermoplasmatales archaeon Gpl]OWP54923.1 MAG: hypothetical protein B2I18_06870 [Cuniculiplasma sp. C_DKE]WMT48536.1 MAG: hypothetical protein RE472_05520 [Thermoplasmatales archaeon]SIM38905.1 membrane protein [Cuniculiplasma divulgatum]SJK84191.1 membrane protein [Cuniculiplasma divulgatum]
MARFKLNKVYLGLLINVLAVVLFYLLYLDILASITPADLTAFGSAIQWEGSMSYIAFVFSSVALIMQIIIFLLRKLAIFIGLENRQ